MLEAISIVEQLIEENPEHMQGFLLVKKSLAEALDKELECLQEEWSEKDFLPTNGQDYEE